MKNFNLRHAFGLDARAQVWATVIDFAAFVKVHPLIYEAKLIAQPTETNAVYAVREKVKLFGWLPMHPRYLVHVQIEGEKVIQSAKIMGMMRLRISLTFKEEDGILWLLEDVEVTPIPLLTGIFWKVFQQAHHTAFATLKKQIEG